MQEDTSNLAEPIAVAATAGAALVVSCLLERSLRTVLVNPRFPNRYKIGRDYQSYARAIPLANWCSTGSVSDLGPRNVYISGDPRSLTLPVLHLRSNSPAVSLVAALQKCRYFRFLNLM